MQWVSNHELIAVLMQLLTRCVKHHIQLVFLNWDYWVNFQLILLFGVLFSQNEYHAQLFNGEGCLFYLGSETDDNERRDLVQTCLYDV